MGASINPASESKPPANGRAIVPEPENSSTVWRDLVNAIVMSPIVPNRFRAPLLRLWGADIYGHVFAGCFFSSKRISIGESFLNRGVFIDGTAPVRIGTQCAIAMECMIITSGHEIGTEECRSGTAIAGPVTIEDGCWLGARVMVMPGVTIGRGCVIAANSVVTADCAPNGLYVGTPARRIRDLA